MHSIRDILREKGTKVQSIDPNENVYEALRQMDEHGIGALLVLEGNKPIGLFSERDYARKLARLIMGGSMMGVALNSDLVPVGSATNCIVATSEQELRPNVEALPCIRCGNCSEACPAFLMPQELNVAAEHNEFGALETLGLFDCIECGCCDVVCPSHIRLTDTFKVGKRRLVQAMDQDTRVRWLDGRELLRRQRVESWEREHSGGAGEEQPLRKRLEAVADVIARVSGEEISA